MNRFVSIPAIVATAVCCGCAVATQDTASNAPGSARTGAARSNPMDGRNGSLKPFRSEQELRAALAQVIEARREALARQPTGSTGCRAWARSDTDVGVECGAQTVETSSVSVAAPRDEITNLQHAGVDEGGIVKRLDNTLLVLRRGRLFTIDTTAGRLAAVDMVDLSGPSSGDHGTWYDELLVSERTAIVIGYSYRRGETEIVLFDVNAPGQLRRRATYYLRSNDYYSGANYAARLIGSTLLLSTSYAVPYDATDLEWLPAMRQWQPAAENGETGGFKRIVTMASVFQPAIPLGIIRWCTHSWRAIWRRRGSIAARASSLATR